MRVTAVLSQATSQTVGGQNIGGFMKTALANNQGQLVIPALVTGTFSNPRFAPDIQQLTQMKLKGLIPNLDNPASLAGTLQNLLGGARPSAPGSSNLRRSPSLSNRILFNRLLDYSERRSNNRKSRLQSESIVRDNFRAATTFSGRDIRMPLRLTIATPILDIVRKWTQSGLLPKLSALNASC